MQYVCTFNTYYITKNNKHTTECQNRQKSNLISKDNGNNHNTLRFSIFNSSVSNSHIPNDSFETNHTLVFDGYFNMQFKRCRKIL